MINCTIVDNTAVDRSGGMDNISCYTLQVSVSGTIFWGNTSESTADTVSQEQVGNYDDNCMTEVTYCAIQGGCSDVDENGAADPLACTAVDPETNSGLYPMFVNVSPTSRASTTAPRRTPFAACSTKGPTSYDGRDSHSR